MKQEYNFSQGVRGRFFRESAKLRFPASDEKQDWIGSEGPLAKFIVGEAKKTLGAYREQPSLVTEHANLEHDTAHGGYAYRQLFELVQNSADALRDAPKGKSILVRLTEGFLYCADDGSPIDKFGIEGLMFARMSSKRNTGAIGRFGLGFKSVLRVTDKPEFYSRLVSFRFDGTRAAERIAGVAPAERYPVLRLPEPFDPHREVNDDDELRELTSWATNVVRLPLKRGAYDDLARQIRDFPPEFLLFVDHVRYLTLEVGGFAREFILEDRQGDLYLDTGEGTGRWRRFETTHCLSDAARSDWPSSGSDGDAPIRWAAPLDHLHRPGQFWAFFPTHTASLVAGILNAPWKTNEDRQNLLPGPYNEELIESAAEMIAEALPKLATNDDPARHLDALPRRHEGGDSKQADLLRKRLFAHLREREVIPDQDCNLRVIGRISYPPKKLTDSSETAPFEHWAAYSGRPRNWLHHGALTHNRVSRLAAINRLFPPRWDGDDRQSAPQASITKWLEALTEGKEGADAIRASMAAIRTAATIPPELTGSNEELGCIVLTANGEWRSPDPERVFLSPDELQDEDGSTGTETHVHPDLLSDGETLSALKTLGLKPPSPESTFRRIARRVLRTGSGQEPSDDLYRQFWIASRKLSVQVVQVVIREHEDSIERKGLPTKLQIRTRAGNWRPPYSVLLPGDIVPEDGSRDKDVIVDTEFHEPDDKLLRDLGVTEAPREDCDLSAEPSFRAYLARWRMRFTSRGLGSNPHTHRLNFETTMGCGPLDVLTRLSDQGRVVYTNALLSLDTTFSCWTMRHETQRHKYPDLSCEPLPTSVLRQAGRIQTSSGLVVPFADALGRHPKSPEALHELLNHPMADKIKATFDLAEPTPEFFGEGDPIPLTDVWPGIREYLPARRMQCRIIRCSRIRVVGQLQKCIAHASDIYLADTLDDEQRSKLQLVADELELDLNPEQIEAILHRRTPLEVEGRRSAIRQCSTDAERLLAAVGEQVLRSDLPDSLLAVLESDIDTLTGTEIAEVAIATYHTDALKQYKSALDRLDPPSYWAGSARAIEFVRSLGFSGEWAGTRDRRPVPFLEIEGRYRLPDLHSYQEVVVRNVREMLRSGHSGNTPRRGMISMPTGSGKTRVAVQAVVEAMRDDGFVGGVLWVADRSELCEQAVEAWRQVWSSIGAHGSNLRVSRMWDAQPKPLPTSELHVIVATIQTLNARLSNQRADYDFLKDFKLVVFDEAHRSIAPTFTSVMDEIGLTRRQGANEPFLLGLTATPYRGHNKEETKWLANRYGGNRLDTGAFDSDDPQDIIQELQSRGVLSQAVHETIEGETFPLDALLEGSLDPNDLQRELDKWLALPWLPPSVEERVAQSVDRTKRIVDAYEAYIDPSWATLIFATSVEHAQTLAALLNRRGVRSRAVSGETEAATRRRVVEEFRRSEVKALVNYGVFREGFDAPKTRAIIVARPVYSPNLYFQMIGRGLRGPLNGGDDRCLILNVRDNIENFDRKLAFSELDWLWA